jgi:cytochrome P450
MVAAAEGGIMAELQQRQPVVDWATDFDFFEPTFVEDPYPVYRRLRSEHPVARSGRYGGMEVLTRWSDLAEVAHDTATFSSRRVVVTEVPTSHPGYPLPPINVDPPDHTVLRRVILPFFNPASIARWEGPIRAICDRMLGELQGRTSADLATEYAQGVPSEVTAMMLGVPAADGDMFRRWIHDLLEVGPTDVEVMRETTNKTNAYLTELLAAHRRERPDDAVTFLIDQTLDGEPLTDEMIVKIMFLLLVAGIDTTWSSIGFALLHLAGHPEDRRRLVAEPELIPTAVEEFLRAYSPVTVARVATRDTEVAGSPVAAGDWVVLAFPAVNRDPEVFPDPERVVIDRQVNRHATFGLGVHRCLGSNLARLEITIALEAFLARYPEFHLTDPAQVTFAPGQIRGPRSIPVTLG